MMADLIDRQAAINAMKELCENYTRTTSTKHPHINFIIEELEALPSVQPEITEKQVKEYCESRNLVVLTSEAYHWLKSLKSKAEEFRWNGGRKLLSDLIDRQAAIKAIEDLQDCYNGFSDTYDKACIIGVIEEIPTAQVNTPTDTPTDTISRQAAIDALHQWEQEYTWDEYDAKYSPSVVSPSDVIAELPSAQPERTCVNCGRTANNGGWYADGRTRCPIEEHYALPKDGYCHLWEKRNVWDDDYPERREDERPES